MTNNKPRRWWIKGEPPMWPYVLKDDPSEESIQRAYSIDGHPLWMVIEYSAYEQAIKERNDLSLDLSTLKSKLLEKDTELDQMRAGVEQLKKESEVHLLELDDFWMNLFTECETALVFYAEPFAIMDYIDGSYIINTSWYEKAREMLSKLKAHKGAE